MRPEQRIDARDFGAAEAQVDARRSGFERRSRIVKGSSADAQHPDPLSGEPAEVYVVSRMGMARRGQIGDQV